MSTKPDITDKAEQDRIPQQRSEGKDPKKQFKTSFLTIRFKLTMAVISVLTVSLSLMAYSTSYYFSEETSIRIQEFNLNIAQGLGRQVESELYSTQSKIHLIASLSLSSGQQGYAKSIFNNNANFIFMSFGSVAKDGNFNSIQSFYNREYMKTNQIDQSSIDGSHVNYKQYFLRAKQNIFNIFNASLGNVPLLGLSFLLDSNLVVVTYIRPNSIFKAFEGHGAVISYMVDELGDIVAHKNSEIYLKRLNLSRSPIVKQMLESPVYSGQLAYRDQDKQDYLGSFQKLTVANLGVIVYVEKDIVFLPIRNLQKRNALILGIILLFALFFIYYFAKTLSVPLMTLLRGMQEVKEGHYDFKIKTAFRDEVGSLTESFLDMAQGLKERSIMKDTLSRFVNQEIAEQALQGKIKLGGERKHATIAFIDLRNFTSMSENMRAEDIVTFLNEYFSGVVKCIIKTGGVVDKYMGDGVMCHWGALRSIENSSASAILSAIEIRKFLQVFNHKLASTKKNRGPKLQVRSGCGIHSGEIISGQVGSEEHLEYTVIGHTVNIASRLEALNKVLGTDILISHETYMQVQGKFKVEIMPPVRIRGKSKPLIIYAVLGSYTTPDTPNNLNILREQLGIPFDAKILQGSSNYRASKT